MGQTYSLDAAYHWPELIFRNGPPGEGARVARFSKRKHSPKYYMKHTKSYVMFNGVLYFICQPLRMLQAGAAKAAIEAAASEEKCSLRV